MIQSFVSMGWTTILWVLFGYSLCFSGGEGAIIGDFSKAFLNGINSDSIYTNGKIPELVFFAYQMMFAIITPALITGAFVNRINFKAYLIFLTVWQILVYYPFVHATAGFAALASVFYVKGRMDKTSQPNSIPLVAIGSGLLWFGWYGFNAGSEVAVDFVTSTAFVNTDIAASFATITWLIIEWSREKKPKLIGLLTGGISGLATITPCAGFVPVWSSPFIGIAAGAVCYSVFLHQKQSIVPVQMD
jgi:Amt family ammonium transporter